MTAGAGSAGKVRPATDIERMTEGMEEVAVSLRFLSPEWAVALTSAVNAKVGLDPVSVSFGAVPSGSGQSATRSVALSQFAAGSYTASISASTGTGVTYAVAPTAGGFVITMTAAKGAGAGIHQAKLTISNAGGEVAHAAVATWIK